MISNNTQDLGDKVAGSQNTEIINKEVITMENSTEKMSTNLDYDKQAISDFMNNDSNKTDMDKLKSLRATLIKRVQENTSKEIVYKIDNFFIDDDAFGIVLKVDLKKVIEETNDSGFEGLVFFFKYVAERRRFQLSPPLKDRQGKPYYWATVKEGMSDVSFKIPIFTGIDRILKSREKVAMYITMEEILEKLK